MSKNTMLITWHEAYRHIAELLHDFYKDNIENSGQELYMLLRETEFAKRNKETLFRERLLKESQWGVDPIQIFVSFNYPRIKGTRIEIINSLLKEFKSNKRVDISTSFEGCPSPVITQIIQYRGRKAQNQIWEMFGAVMDKGIEGLANKHFLSLKEWRGVDIASLTMFLFWINSDEFIPLDQNTVEFLRSFGIIAQRPRSYKEYYDLCKNRLQLSSDLSENENVIRNFVRDSYQYSNKNSAEEILSGSTATIISRLKNEENNKEELEIIAKQKRQERINAFQIIALRPLNSNGKNGIQKEQGHLKNLKQGELYQFYHSYKFDDKDDKIITYDSDKDVDLYSQGDLKISISSIVGKNGSGKSTIAEFLYLVINKISFEKKIKSAQTLNDEEVYADLFVKLDKLYKISVGSSIEIIEYKLQADNKTYLISKGKIGIEVFDLERFCYTIAVNYSLYALNTKIIGNWIYPLFHKNDSYQTPIVLNPLREDGKIDVNNEEGLAKSRMLSNILEPELINFEKDVVPDLVPNSIPVNLALEFDKAKLDRKKAEFRYKRRYRHHIDKIIDALGIKDSDHEYAKETKEYIYLKAVVIADRYSKFRRNFKELPNWISSDSEKLEKYVIALFKDTSHITFKLKQAINFLKYGIYKNGNNEILLLAKEIRNIKEDTGIRTIELVPPSFFKTNIIFEHGGTFNDLSSGEKQQIFSINTIAYHIYNISSVMYEVDSYKYNNINIIFDEVELYFHPEMQRTYISNLLHRISTLKLEGSIHNINMLFITHSPFILSDIPSSNILRLTTDRETKKSIPAPHSEKTFGANIHDLLANDFFLENGFMGDFSKKRINEIIQFLNIHKLVSMLEQVNQKSKLENNQLKEQREKLEYEIGLIFPEFFNKDNNDQINDKIIVGKLEKNIFEKFNLNPNDCLSTIKIIGEPILRHKLLAMYNETFAISDNEIKEQEFLKLAKQLNYIVIKE